MFVFFTKFFISFLKHREDIIQQSEKIIWKSILFAYDIIKKIKVINILFNIN